MWCLYWSGFVTDESKSSQKNDFFFGSSVKLMSKSRWVLCPSAHPVLQGDLHADIYVLYLVITQILSVFSYLRIQKSFGTFLNFIACAVWNTCFPSVSSTNSSGQKCTTSSNTERNMIKGSALTTDRLGLLCSQDGRKTHFYYYAV